ncbi:BOLA class I histocompatibility antigen, alpha chain BL3-7-like [Salvelinus namaycush]|uniref:BOLA class I histocompatibility antigen, alpha chain BL3-7-like n=1 Tax=Salvelinus namaycush TaxID=8040 RepID=A0A8U0PMN2_SALNM|nr:BOLA class I histocompatibility antigen, alpha chain BL3-7-like [Salvelinus namaycush]
MKGFILMFLGIVHLHEAFGVTYSLKHFYTASSDIPNFPEFVVVGMVDGVQMVHYDSNSQRAVPKQDWMKQTDAEFWESERENFFDSQQSFKVEVHILKQRFNQIGGVHILQYIYGCSLDNESEQKEGFGQLRYNGENFLVYDMKTLAWKSLKQQADFMQDKWNHDHSRLVFWRIYFTQTCIECLKKQVVNGKSILRRTASPSVSLLQKTPSSPVTCHATGFYPSGVMVFWQKDGQEQHEDVENGETLPNDDGTFQKSAHLTVTPEEWKNNTYQCVVQVTGIKEDFIKVLTESEIQTNWGKTNRDDPAPNIVPIIGVAVALLLVVVVAVVVGVFIWKKKSKKGFVPASTNDTDSAYSGKGLLKT